ncbi:MAG: transporter substrate-binding domain-containing protein [Proteobacteria bacterium]|nr:transporter substrate-binding domain-containing protein [Pseudomonadota bacterium]
MNIAVLVVNTTISVVALCMVSVCAEPLVFQSTDTPPYWSSQLPDNGFGGTVLHLMSENAGVSYTLEYLPVKRYRQSTAPYIVGDPDMLINQKHRAVFPVGIFRSAFFFYKPHHDVIEFHSIRDMKGYTLGVLRGTIEDKASYLANGVNVEESDSVESLLRKLKKGRIDLCITVAGAGSYTIQKLFPQEKDNFVPVLIPGLDRPIAIMIDLDDPEGRGIARRYRQVLDKTLHSQQYQAILENFYGKNNVTADRQAQLNKFIQYYTNTWGAI